MLRHLFRSRPSRRAKARPTFRPTLEGIEERIVPADLGSFTPFNQNFAALANPAFAAQIQAAATAQINALNQLLATETALTVTNLNNQILALDKFVAGLDPFARAAVAEQVAKAEIQLADGAIVQLSAIRDLVAGQEVAILNFVSQLNTIGVPLIPQGTGGGGTTGGTTGGTGGGTTGGGGGQTSGSIATGTYVGTASPNGNFSSSTANVQNVNQTVTVNINSVNNEVATGSVTVSPFTGTPFNGNFSVSVTNGTLSQQESNGIQFVGVTFSGNTLNGGLSVTRGNDSLTLKNLTLTKQ